uniref:OrfA n=1 Tax=Feline immunodeficiency virus TaxID=11673 RepID=A0A895HPM8_9RETR|nr:OrfA [Feline immunodeficiency virus]QRZ21108.1 OrfA [Feline immunodeficiency virus]QRZ21114.1 OrfA [Feline immunodeficiency virus]QWY12959.1 OrfA [Feline immunodeficiency virus]
MEEIIPLFNKVTEKLDKETAIRLFILAYQEDRGRFIRILQLLLWRDRFKSRNSKYCLCWLCCRFAYWRLQSTLSINTA